MAERCNPSTWIWTRARRTWPLELILLALIAGCSDGTRGWVLIKGSAGTGDPVPADDAGGFDAPMSDPAQACSPEVSFENRDEAGSGRLFNALVPDPQALLLRVTREVCRILYRAPSEVPIARSVHLVVEDFNGVGSVSGAQGAATVRLSSRYMQSVQDSGRDLLAEITGILYFHGANIYQRNAVTSGDEWVWQGVANYVRHRTGYLPISRRPVGGSYRDGFAYSGFFFVWLEERRAGFVYSLNQSLAPSPEPWSASIFRALAGNDIDALWAEYQASL